MARLSSFVLLLLVQFAVASNALSAHPRAYNSLAAIFARDSSDCIDMVKCPPPEDCKCVEPKVCIISPPDCYKCPVAECKLVQNFTQEDEDKKDGPNIGAIAGGVIGGIALVGLGAFFWLRKKKRVQEEDYIIDETLSEKSEGLGMLKSARASTHTVASMASGLSNFIQIAYVPGVTARSGPTTPNGLIPPVPAIPYGHRDSTTTVQTRQPQSPVSDEVFYLVPNRASTFTTHSDFSTPGDRSSVATTIYGQGAQQTVIQPVRAKAAMVTVKSSPNSNASTPEVQQGSFSSGGLTSGPLRRTVVAARSPLINQEPSSPISLGYQSYETAQEDDKRRSAYSTTRSEMTDSEWGGNADEETMSMAKGKNYAQHRMTQSTYLTTTTEIETGSPFSDRHSVQSVDEFNFPLPHGTGMPPASIHSGHSRVASPALSQRTLMLHSPKEPRHKSPFDDTEDDR